MFVSKLNSEQQAVLLDLTMQLIKVDGEFHEQEEEMLKVIKAQCDAGVEPKNLQLTELPALFPDQEAKVCLLLELIAIAHADKVLHHREKNLISDLADALSVSFLLDDAHEWVAELMAHMDTAEALMVKAEEPKVYGGLFGGYAAAMLAQKNMK